jgi:hypothetical protein
MSNFSVNAAVSSSAKQDERKSLLPSVHHPKVEEDERRVENHFGKRKYKSIILSVCSFILVTEVCCFLSTTY